MKKLWLIPILLVFFGCAYFEAQQAHSTDMLTAPTGGYEEGTWTPTVGGTATYVNQVGSYIKIGRLVRASGFVNITLIGTGSTSNVQGLPFVSANALGAETHCSVYWTVLSASPTSVTGVIAPATSTIGFFSTLLDTDTGMLQNAILGNGSWIHFTCVYYTQ